MLASQLAALEPMHAEKTVILNNRCLLSIKIVDKLLDQAASR